LIKGCKCTYATTDTTFRLSIILYIVQEVEQRTINAESSQNHVKWWKQLQ